jgi:hypothetical protein
MMTLLITTTRSPLHRLINFTSRIFDLSSMVVKRKSNDQHDARVEAAYVVANDTTAVVLSLLSTRFFIGFKTLDSVRFEVDS